mgnify:CR=1 FL=1
MSDTQDPVEDDGSPRHKHLKKLHTESQALKKSKEKNKAQHVEYKVVYDSRGKAKYRKISYMENGNKHSEYISPKAWEKIKLKEEKKKAKKD